MTKKMWLASDIIDWLNNFEMSDIEVLLDAVESKIESVERHIKRLKRFDDDDLNQSATRFSEKQLARLVALRDGLAAAIDGGKQ